MTSRNIFITGGTGYVGSRLIPDLLKRGHTVRALVRKGSESKLPAGCEPIVGDPLDKASFAGRVSPSDTFVQLVGVPKPSPAKGAQFRAIDLVSIQQSVPAAVEAGIKHFVYVSVAHPAPIMKDYIEVRSEGERLIRASGLRATVLRPWYVLGPGHRCPVVLKPLYWLAERNPSTRAAALRLGLVTVEQMIAALALVVAGPPKTARILTVPDIRRATL